MKHSNVYNLLEYTEKQELIAQISADLLSMDLDYVESLACRIHDSCKAMQKKEYRRKRIFARSAGIDNPTARPEGGRSAGRPHLLTLRGRA